MRFLCPFDSSNRSQEPAPWHIDCLQTWIMGCTYIWCTAALLFRSQSLQSLQKLRLCLSFFIRQLWALGSTPALVTGTFISLHAVALIGSSCRSYRIHDDYNFGRSKLLPSFSLKQFRSCHSVWLSIIGSSGFTSLLLLSGLPRTPDCNLFHASLSLLSSQHYIPTLLPWFSVASFPRGQVSSSKLIRALGTDTL